MKSILFIRLRLFGLCVLAPFMLGSCALSHHAFNYCRDVGVNFQRIGSTETLPDGDVIVLAVTPINDPQRMEIALQSGPSVTWWKALDILDLRHDCSQIYALETQDANHGPSFISLSSTEAHNSVIHLSKAKFLGIHTGMYQVYFRPLQSDLSLTPFLGHRLTFTWERD